MTDLTNIMAGSCKWKTNDVLKRTSAFEASGQGVAGFDEVRVRACCYVISGLQLQHSIDYWKSTALLSIIGSQLHA